MCAEQPSLELRYDQMNAGQDMLPLFLMALHMKFVAVFFQAWIGGKADGADRAAWRDGLLDKPVQRCLGQIRVYISSG